VRRIFIQRYGNIEILDLFPPKQMAIAVGWRPFSTEVAKSHNGGAGFFSRVSSFLVGAGMTALAAEFYIFKEVREGNLEMLKRHNELEKRISALEKKK
jgi:hypothetical protein